MTKHFHPCVGCGDDILIHVRCCLQCLAFVRQVRMAALRYNERYRVPASEEAEPDGGVTTEDIAALREGLMPYRVDPVTCEHRSKSRAPGECRKCGKCDECDSVFECDECGDVPY